MPHCPARAWTPLALRLTLALVVLATIAPDSAAKSQPGVILGGSLDCSNATPISCDQSLNSSTIGLPNNASAYSCVGWDASGGEEVYELVLDDEYVVNCLLSGVGADLDLYLLDACDEASCVAFGNILLTTTVGPGTYYVVVDGRNGAEDFYVLTVTCDPVVDPAPPLAGGETCLDAVDLVAGGLTRFSTDLTTYSDEYDSDCFPWFLPGGDAIYRIDLNAGELFEVTMNGPCDMAMYIMGNCASGESLACSDNCCSGAQEVISYVPTFSGTYYLILDTFLSTGCEVIVEVTNGLPTGVGEGVQTSSWGRTKALHR